ncbi:hypothetical protein TNCV_2189501 [Trichonephila clavipes]|nr:hypothetical protein TNCV_2189501 [Trichonephila clavipes]
MVPHSITPVVEAVLPLHSEGRIDTFTTGPPHTYTIPTTAQIKSGSVAENDPTPFGCNPIPLSMTLLQSEVTEFQQASGTVVSINTFHEEAHSLGSHGRAAAHKPY